MAKGSPDIKGISVGGKHYYLVEQEELVRAYQLLNEDADEFPTAIERNTGGFTVRSLLIPQHSYNGVLYRTGEHILANHYGDPKVLKIGKIFSLNIDSIYYVFVNGIKYLHEDIHSQSGNPIVKESETVVTIKGQDILRKVMLYPYEITNHFIVIDYERPSFLLSVQDILVPQFPEPSDMVSVSGENGETWLAHVQTTNPSSKWCQVYFYVPDEDNPKLYKKEHHRLERVHWNSILCLVQGQWQNDSHYLLYDSI